MAQYVYSMNRVGKIVPPKKEILKDISLSFFPGAKIGVLGLNGAGKSTTMKIVTGLARSTRLGPCQCSGSGAGNCSPLTRRIIRSTPAEMPAAKSPALNFGGPAAGSEPYRRVGGYSSATASKAC